MVDAAAPVVLFDLDGVVRHFNPGDIATVEQRHGLRPGLVLEAAFTPSLLEPAITGRCTRHEWAVAVGELIACPDAALEWLTLGATVDSGVLDVVDELRAADITVAVLTNGTSTIDAEMAELGLAKRFDAIFNSYDIGYAKPDRRAFSYVCDKLNVDPTQVFFTDDSASKLAGARELGMTVAHFTSIEKLRSDLAAFGLPL